MRHPFFLSQIGHIFHNFFRGLWGLGGGKLVSREITGTAMESLPAAVRRVNQWVRKRTSNCWNYDTNCREAVAHFMITDDLKKPNIQVNKFLEDVFYFYNNRIRQQVNRYLRMIACFSDSCGYQFKSRWLSLNSSSLLTSSSSTPQIFLQTPTRMDGRFRWISAS